MACRLSRPALAMQGADPVVSVVSVSSLRWRPRTCRAMALASALFTCCLVPHMLLAQGQPVVGKGVIPPKHHWTTFVSVEGQPEPVPAEWVATPEGRFAHAIKIPNPVPKDSGYRWWWTSKQYFLHLCEKEAGEFVYKTAEDVQGFLFMRPPKRPTDFDLMDLYKLEAPGIERGFQSYREDIRSRGRQFVSVGRSFTYFEEPYRDSSVTNRKYAKAIGYDRKSFELSKVDVADEISSRYAVTWRGLRRPKDREHKVAGVEVVVLDLHSMEAMAVWRDFSLAGNTRGVRDGVWWLNAAGCPQFRAKYARPEVQQLYEFIRGVLRPIIAK